MTKIASRQVLDDHARKHHVKLLFCGRLRHTNLDEHKELICQAAQQLQGLPPGEEVIVEGFSAFAWIIAKSERFRQPCPCSLCQALDLDEKLPGSHVSCPG